MSVDPKIVALVSRARDAAVALNQAIVDCEQEGLTVDVSVSLHVQRLDRKYPRSLVDLSIYRREDF